MYLGEYEVLKRSPNRVRKANLCYKRGQRLVRQWDKALRYCGNMLIAYSKPIRLKGGDRARQSVSPTENMGHTYASKNNQGFTRNGHNCALTQGSGIKGH